MEIVNGTEITYLYAQGQPFALHKKNVDESTCINYLHLDYQGSLMAISDNTGNVIENRSYDAWGRPRNPDNWEYDQSNTFGGGGFGISTRGYTMHEHLEMFNLINMNGRLYDPLLGRMLSPDNYIQAPDNTQNFNRYSYCVNNPLKYTDPTGEIIPFLAVVAIVAVVSGSMNLAVNWKNTKNFGDGLYYFGLGAAVGAAATVGGAALAPVIGTGAIAGAVMGASSGFVMGYGNTGYATGNWGSQALEAGGWGALYGGIGGAVVGGTISGLRGNNIWTGAKPTPGSSVFSFGDVVGAKGSPSWSFKNIENIGTRDFWKYGKNFKVYNEKLSNGTFPRMEVDDFLDKVGPLKKLSKGPWQGSVKGNGEDFLNISPNLFISIVKSLVISFEM